MAGVQKMQQSLAPLTALTQPNVFANMPQIWCMCGKACPACRIAACPAFAASTTALCKVAKAICVLAVLAGIPSCS